MGNIDSSCGIRCIRIRRGRPRRGCNRATWDHTIHQLIDLRLHIVRGIQYPQTMIQFIEEREIVPIERRGAWQRVRGLVY